MTSKDPWLSIVKALEPNIEELKVAMMNGFSISPDLKRIGKRWKITLQELYISGNNKYPIDGSFEYKNLDNIGRLDQCVNWSTKQLENWIGVRRTAYNIWEFNRKKDAEKFQIIFSLTWEK